MKGSEHIKNNAIREVLQGAGIIYIGIVLEMGLAFIAQRFAAVYLSVDGFGNLISGTVLLNIGAILAGLGFAPGLARYLPRIDQAKQRSLATYTFLIIIPASLVVAVPTVIFANQIATYIFREPSLATSLRIFGAAIPFAAIMNLGIGGSKGLKISRFRVYTKNILHPGSRAVLIIFAIVIGADQLGFAVSYAIPFVLAGVLSFSLFWYALPDESDKEGARQIFPDFIRFSLPFTISKLSSFIYRSLDIVLLLYFIGNNAVGAYSVAYALARLIFTFSTALDYLSTPVASQLESGNQIEEAVSVQTIITRWNTILTIGAMVPMIVFSADFIRLIYRPAYASEAPTLIILLIGFAIKNMFQAHEPVLAALGKSKLMAFNTLVAGIINLVVNLLLIPQYGSYGAAIATTLSYTVLSVLPTIEVKYFTGETTLSMQVFKPIIVAVPVTVIFSLLFRAIPSTLLWIFGASGVFALAYAIAIIVILGFTQTETMVIRSAENKFGYSLESFDWILQK